jgi:RND family efflux transporter MFP subunit
MRKNRALSGLQYLLLISLSSIVATNSFAESQAHPVRVTSVELRPVVRQVSTYGVLAPKIEDLSFRINGRIKQFSVVEGQSVVKGQTLATLETRDATDKLNQARVQRDQAARKLERFEKLAEERMVQTSELENTRDELKTARINFEQAELELERSTLIAPADGIILKEHEDSRTTITAGTPIYSFRDISKSWVTEVELTDQNALAFGIGTTARAKFAPYPGEIFNGTLTKQAGVADRRDGLYTVDITIDDKGRELRPGMVVEVDLTHETQQSYTMIPLDALVDLRANQGSVYILDESQTQVSEVTVNIVMISAGWVALVEPIPECSKVVTRGQQSLRHGSDVRVL